MQEVTMAMDISNNSCQLPQDRTVQTHLYIRNLLILIQETIQVPLARQVL